MSNVKVGTSVALFGIPFIGIRNLNLRTNHPEEILFTSVFFFYLASARSLGGLELTAVSTDKLFIVAICRHQHSVISNEAFTSLI